MVPTTQASSEPSWMERERRLAEQHESIAHDQLL